MADRNIYLVARYIQKPKNPKLTAQPGYMSNPDNIDYEEEMFVAQGFKNRYLNHHVILNLTEQKVIKNTFNSGKTFEEIFNYFYNTYSDYLNDNLVKSNEISSN
jgi:hypothetical protein